MSIKICKFPNALKYAELCPILKKGSNLDVSNYRPVSILPSVSKIFEREIVNQLYMYFNPIFNPRLSGFRKQHSCETVLLEMIENIKISLDKGKVVCVLLMDLSRAFDCIPYKLFISKLRAYGLSQHACNYVLSYYCARQQRVKIGKFKSEWMTVNKGCAQGSLMGPLSYNLFSNDMLYILDNDVDIYNYADDNSLVCSGYDYDDVKSKLLSNVNKVIKWFESNHMKVNEDKFQCIVFGKKDNLGTFRIGDHDIVPEEYVKLLGLHVDRKLNFNTHISNISQKAGRQVKVISRLCYVLDQPSKMMLYNSFVECYFNYCAIIWHFCNKSDTFKLEKIQEKALRVITKDFKSSYHSLLSKCNKSSLYVARIRKMQETIFKIINGMCPTYLSNIVNVKKTTINLRCENLLSIPKFKTVTYGKNSFIYKAPCYWNKVPNNVKNAQSMSSFKMLIRQWSPECNCGHCILCKITNM